MAVKKQSSPSQKIGIAIIYCMVIFCATAWSIKKPAYNWDTLAYMGVVLSYENAGAKAIHNTVYSIAKQQIPAVYYGRLIDPSNVYRNDMAQNPERFYSQFPFYIVKPMYTRLAWVFYKMGMGLVMATVWPSAVAYFFTGLLLFAWLNKYWPGWHAGIASTLIMLSPPILTVAALSTPDALSGLLLFAAVFFLTEMKSLTAAFVCLILSVFARLDNILPAICLLSVNFFTNKWPHKTPVSGMLFLYGSLLLAYFVVSLSVRSFGWNVLFYPAFIRQLNLSYTAATAFDFAAYAALVKSQLTTGLYFSFVVFFCFLVLLLLRSDAPLAFSRLSTEQILAIVFVLIMALRFLLQPLIADRLYTAYYLAIMAFLVKKNSLTVSLQQA